MALPIAIFIAVYFMNREYVMLLFTHPIWEEDDDFGIVMQILGRSCIKKIIDIKV